MNSFLLLVLLVCSTILSIDAAIPADCRAQGMDCPNDATCTIYPGTPVVYHCEWSRGLSPGATAGIIIGVIAVITGVSVAICFFAKCGCFGYRRNAPLSGQMAAPFVQPPQYQQQYQQF